MFHKPRYIHVQTPGGKKNGFSVLLSPHDNPNTVNVSVTYCSKKDQFCKRTARQELHFVPPVEVPVNKLPMTLAAYRIRSIGPMVGDEFVDFSNPYFRSYSNQWAWVWKYFL